MIDTKRGSLNSEANFTFIKILGFSRKNKIKTTAKTNRQYPNFVFTVPFFFSVRAELIFFFFLLCGIDMIDEWSKFTYKVTFIIHSLIK